MTHTCTQCNYTWTPRPKTFEQPRDKPVACPQCQSRKWSDNPATDIEAARRHHEMHGDIDGKTCLLNKCALHYPLERKG
jgi:ssDNA-binding Zn-finger/Zn-ribbon topoisomerase 1